MFTIQQWQHLWFHLWSYLELECNQQKESTDLQVYISHNYNKTSYSYQLLDVWNGVSNMAKREGPQALWRGLLPTMLRDVPFSGIYWMGYEKIRHRLQTHHELSHFQTSFIAGASSGMIAAIVTTPFDVVKTQRQVSLDAEEARLGRILKNIIRKNGSAGFFRGVVPRVVKVAPACAIMISSYEMGKHFFANRKLQLEQL